jgi:hypothetical protein
MVITPIPFVFMIFFNSINSIVNPRAHDDNCFEIKINNICVYFSIDGYES